MDLETYFKESARTSSVEPDSISMKILHGAMGICTEVIEFHKSYEEGDEKNCEQELGDIFWYIAETCRGINVNLLDLDFHGDVSMDSIAAILEVSGNILDQAKRITFYKAHIDSEIISELLSCLCTELNALIEDNGYDLEDILDKNIKKLRIRFPNKFSCDAAINRNVEKEEKVFG
jgi:NTP pyrophosphatase (non-canonical NTP hydrolase)